MNFKAKLMQLSEIRFSKKDFLKVFFITLLFIAIGFAGVVVKGMFVQTISGWSMFPTYSDGDTVAYTTNLDSIERGDIVFFRQDGSTLVKRVIGCPGDEIEVFNGYLYVNGEKYLDYAYGKTIALSTTTKWVCGENDFFVLGDNREDSVDSRYFGTISKAVIFAKAKD